MKKHLLRLTFFFCLIQFFTSCTTTNFFNIRLWDEKMYDEINVLVNEIYQNARNGNVDFFRYFFDRNLRSFNERGREIFGDLHVDTVAWREDIVIGYLEDIMRQIVQSRLYRTYKQRAFLGHRGIWFDYTRYSPERGIRYAISLTFDQDDNLVIGDIWTVRCNR